MRIRISPAEAREVVQLLNNIERRLDQIMANQADLAAAIEAAKAEVLSTIVAEKVETQAKVDNLQLAIADLTEQIRILQEAGTVDLQASIDAVNAAFAEVKTQVADITTA